MGTTPQVESCQLFSFFFCDERERENFPYFSDSPPRFLPHRNNKVFLLPMKSHRTLRRSLRNAPKALLFPCFSLSFISRLLAELHGGSTFIIAMKSATRKWRRRKRAAKKKSFFIVQRWVQLRCLWSSFQSLAYGWCRWARGTSLRLKSWRHGKEHLFAQIVQIFHLSSLSAFYSCVLSMFYFFHSHLARFLIKFVLKWNSYPDSIKVCDTKFFGMT